MNPTIQNSNDDVIRELMICGFEAAIILRQRNILELFITRDMLQVLENMQQLENFEMTLNDYERFFEIYTYEWVLRDGETGELIWRDNLVLSLQEIERLQRNLMERFIFDEIQPIVENFFRNSDAQYAYLWADIDDPQYHSRVRLEPWNNQVCIPEIVPGIHQNISVKST